MSGSLLPAFPTSSQPDLLHFWLPGFSTSASLILVTYRTSSRSSMPKASSSFLEGSLGIRCTLPLCECVLLNVLRIFYACNSIIFPQVNLWLLGGTGLGLLYLQSSWASPRPGTRLTRAQQNARYPRGPTLVTG